MKLDNNLFPQNMAGFAINMVNAVKPEDKGNMQVLTSARARQDGSVDPNQQVTIEQIRKRKPHFPNSQVEVGQSSRPRVTSSFSINGSVSRRRNTTSGLNTKKRKRDMRQKDIERNKRRLCESKLVHIGDVLSLDIAGMKV
jgi:hypothetical protein